MLTQSSPSLPILVCPLSRAPTTYWTSMNCISYTRQKMLLQGGTDYSVLKQQLGGACQHSPANNCGTISTCALLSTSCLLFLSADTRALQRVSRQPLRRVPALQNPVSAEPHGRPHGKTCIYNTRAGLLVGL